MLYIEKCWQKGEGLVLGLYTSGHISTAGQSRRYNDDRKAPSKRDLGCTIPPCAED